MNLIQDFRVLWLGQFGELPPFAPLVRERLQSRWVRVHTLTGSKRYADNNRERQEILKRHNRCLQDVLGGTRDYYLLTTAAGKEKKSSSRPTDKEGSAIDPQSEFLMTLPSTVITGSRDGYFHFFVSRKAWKPESMNSLLLLVAEDVIDNVVFCSSGGSRLYMPYDGGSDMILESSSKAAAFRKKYSEWLGTGPGGL